MQQAFVAFPGDGILRLREIKDHRAVFDDYGIARGNEKILDRAYKGFWGHAELLQSGRYLVCDE